MLWGGIVHRNILKNFSILYWDALSSAARKLGLIIMEGCLRDCASSIQNMNIEKDVKVKVEDTAKAIYRFINMK